VSGNFDWSNALDTLDNYHRIALENRPDLRAAVETIEQSRTNHQLAKANGSTDPTYSGWWTHNPSFANPNDADTIGLSVSIPLRIF